MSIMKKITKIYSKLKWRLRFLNAGSRVLPDFLIIGASKCGTSSLWDYLVRHPNVLSNYKYKKEIQYFDQKTQKGLSWYKAHFPTRKTIMEKEKDKPILKDDENNMDIFEEDLGNIMMETKLTPLGVAAILLKNALTIYGNTIDKESMEMLVNFAMEQHTSLEDVGNNTVH